MHRFILHQQSMKLEIVYMLFNTCYHLPLILAIPLHIQFKFKSGSLMNNHAHSFICDFHVCHLPTFLLGYVKIFFYYFIDNLLYILHESCVRYEHYTWSLPGCALPSRFLNGIFWWTNVLNFNVIQSVFLFPLE